MSDCERIRQAGAYCDGELSAEERGAFEAHVADCADCAREVRQLASLSRLIAGTPIPEVSAETLRGLHANAASVRERVVLTLTKRLTAAAAAVIVVCVAWAGVGHGQSGASSTLPASWELAAVRLDAGTFAGDAQPMAQWIVADLSLENGHD